MTFKYSICHPEKENIEYKNNPISGNEVLKIASNYPWINKLKVFHTLIRENINYNPSLDFTCIETGKSFCLTANFDENEQLEFSLWYNRPQKTKILFGLLGEKEKMVVDEIWSNSFNKSIKYLKHFVNGNYTVVEELYNN
ncbi:hypothetical protein [Winogradskyella sp. SM1960]|uniref:hypothetical protein n=1 Tax=Winogradskyella sp. SM1960 TaxID=2865955 RepID=UPI001CD484DA|nr:hypothetical protein [Winogradskyella sp. SM1960]